MMENIAAQILDRHALSGSWWYDLETREIWWSEGIYGIHDVDPSEYTPTPETVGQFYEPESAARVRAALERVVEEGSGWSLTLLMRRASGELRYVHSVAQVEQRPGKAPLIAGAFFDIHDATVERIEHEAHTQHAMRRQGERWRTASENVGLSLIDFDSQVYRVSGAIVAHLDVGVDNDAEIPADRWAEFVHPDDRAVRQQRLTAHRAEKSVLYVSEYRLCVPDKDALWVKETACRVQPDEPGAAQGRMTGTLQDISERKRAEQAIFQAREMADVTFEAIGEGLMRVDRAGRITEVNSAACSLLDCDADTLVNALFADCVQFYEAGRLCRIPDPVERVLRDGEQVRVPVLTRLRRRDGQYLSIVDSVSPIRDDTGEVSGAVFVFQDISEVREMTENLVHQASHDPLTGLPNRRGFEQALESAWKRVHAGMAHMYVIYMDLDSFKQINDTSGHAVGDDVLRRVALAFRSMLRESDMLARIGGDEFAAIIQSKSVDGVSSIARKLIAAANDMEALDCQSAGVSLGIAALEPGLPSSEAALLRADAALYVAKDAGGGCFHFYDPNAHTRQRSGEPRHEPRSE